MQDAVDKGATVVVGGAAARRAGLVLPADAADRHHARRWSCTTRRSSGRSPRCSPSTDLDEAIEIANSHPYGLGSNLWSEDEGERAQFVRDIASGMAFINGMTTSYPELPFGGVKQSGYGRELTELGHARVHERQDRLGRRAEQRAGGRHLGGVGERVSRVVVATAYGGPEVLSVVDQADGRPARARRCSRCARPASTRPTGRATPARFGADPGEAAAAARLRGLRRGDRGGRGRRRPGRPAVGR